jgi:hypothetical protein
MQLNNFLNRFGMAFTTKCLHLPDQISVADNQAEHSHFGHAFLKLTAQHDPECSPRDRELFLKTVADGLDVLEENKDQRRVIWSFVS